MATKKHRNQEQGPMTRKIKDEERQLFNELQAIIARFESNSDSLNVIKDAMLEAGFTLDAAEDGIKAAIESLEQEKENLKMKILPPKGLKGEQRYEWCEKNGGHSISSFWESWGCQRCGLSGID